MTLDRAVRRRLVREANAAPGAPDVPDRPVGPVLVSALVLTLALVGASALVRTLQRPDAVSVADGDLLVARSSGARYLDLGGRLHPLRNVASARLLVGDGEPRVLVVDDDVLHSLPHGPATGIPGAPDDLPAASALEESRWTACPVGDAVRLDISRPGPRPADPSGEGLGTSSSRPDGPAVVVRPGDPSLPSGGGVTYLLVDGSRLPLPPPAAAALRGALDQSSPPTVVPARLLDLLPPGAPLDVGSLDLGAAGLGAPLTAALRRPGVVRVGQLVDVDGGAGLVLADGVLPLDPFAAAVYAATAPSGLGRAVPLSAADAAGLPLSSRPDPAPIGWPRSLPAAGRGVPCVRLDVGTGAPTTSPSTGPSTGTSTSPSTGPTADPTTDPTTDPTSSGSGGPHPRLELLGEGAVATSGAGVVVEPGVGSLVRVGPVAAEGPVLLVDGTGTAFPVGAPLEDTLTRLGYADVPVVPVPDPWAALLPRGPTLSVAAVSRPSPG